MSPTPRTVEKASGQPAARSFARSRETSDWLSFGVAPVLLGAFDIDADGATILGGAAPPVLFGFGGTVSTAGATTTAGFTAVECTLP